MLKLLKLQIIEKESVSASLPLVPLLLNRQLHLPKQLIRSQKKTDGTKEKVGESRGTKTSEVICCSSSNKSHRQLRLTQSANCWVSFLLMLIPQKATPP